MLRVVAFKKAILAGAAGAFVWEAAARMAALLGFPIFDLVRALGTLPFPHGSTAQWWPAGLAAHVAVGIIWAVFYAYFGWARLRWPPPLQGLVFVAVPAVLAIFIVIPQFQLMHLSPSRVHVDWHILLAALTPQILGTVLPGHALFGLTVGALYTHPVGYPATGKSPKPPRSNPSCQRHRKPTQNGFIFATGIECSYPTNEQGRWRRDEMAATRHYERWSDDFDLARQLGVTHIRYGPPLHLIFTGPGRYSWEWCDEPMRELEQSGPEPIVDLCHFGVPTWLGNFQNADIAPAFAEYAGAFAQRYPWARFYTPVNEMYVCARMSALQGVWNEQLTDERAFARAAINLASACVAMTDAILAVRPEAIFINNESSEFSQPCCPQPGIRRIAEFENERRFLPLDLLYGNQVSRRMLDYLCDNGVNASEYDRFMNRGDVRRSVIGLDYYEWNERLIDRQGNPQALGELFGWYVIAMQYWQRYERTLMHTETNRTDANDAPRWLWRQWHNVQLLRNAGVPIIGFTWYSLTDQIDWGQAVEEPFGLVHPIGLFDLNRDPRLVGLSYKHLIDAHRDIPEYRDCQALNELLD